MRGRDYQGYTRICMDCAEEKMPTEMAVEKGIIGARCRVCKQLRTQEYNHGEPKYTRQPKAERRCISCQGQEPEVIFELRYKNLCKTCKEARKKPTKRDHSPVPEGHVRCHQCHEVKPNEEMTRRRTTDGQWDYHSPCKRCHGWLTEEEREQNYRTRYPNGPITKSPEYRAEQNERLRQYKQTEQGRAARSAWREKRRAAKAIAQASHLAELAERRAETEATRELKSQVRRMLRDKRIKKCARCGEIFDWSEFYWDKALQRPDSYCKSCVAQKTTEWSKAHAAQVAAAAALRNPEYKKRYKETHREQWQEAHRAAKHRRRAYKRGNGGTYTVAQWAALKIRYQYRCLACGQSEPAIQLTVDHVVPLSQGGTNDISNIQPLCMECNTRKGAQTRDYRNPRPRTSTYTASWENRPEIHQQASFLDQCS